MIKINTLFFQDFDIKCVNVLSGLFFRHNLTTKTVIIIITIGVQNMNGRIDFDKLIYI